MRTILALSAALLWTAAAEASPRGDAWREDLRVAREQFLPKDLSFSASARAAAAARFTALEGEVERLDDPHIVAEIARTVASADNAHTRAYLLRNRGWWRRYPIRIWRFSDGWRVIAVRPGYEPLLGGRIESIGGVPVEAAARRVRPLYAGVDGWADYMASYELTSPDALLGTDVLQGDGAAQFVVRKGGRRLALSVSPGPVERRETPEESWWFLSPRHSASAGWVHVLQGRALPAYLADPTPFYRVRQCSGGVTYLQFNRAEDDQGETIADMGERLLETLRARRPAKLVVDLRFNTGGNLLKARALFDALAETPYGAGGGRLFVIEGPSTFSAALNHAASLKQNARAVLVGSGPGDRPDFWAEGGNVKLPNSGITLHYADRAHLYSDHAPPIDKALLYAKLNVRSLKPDLAAALSFADYLAGRDPAMERITHAPLACEA